MVKLNFMKAILMATFFVALPVAAETAVGGG